MEKLEACVVQNNVNRMIKYGLKNLQNIFERVQNKHAEAEICLDCVTRENHVMRNRKTGLIYANEFRRGAVEPDQVRKSDNPTKNKGVSN